MATSCQIAALFIADDYRTHIISIMTLPGSNTIAHVVNYRVGFCLSTVLLLCGLAIGSSAFYAGQTAETFKVAGDKGFKPVKQSMDALVRLKATTRYNHFCVVGYRQPDGSKQAWVYWREAKALILLEPHSPDSDGTYDLLNSRRYLRLDRDVVASDNELGASSYKVTKAWVEHTIQDCLDKGERFILLKKHRGKIKGKTKEGMWRTSS